MDIFLRTSVLICKWSGVVILLMWDYQSAFLLIIVPERKSKGKLVWWSSLCIHNLKEFKQLNTNKEKAEIYVPSFALGFQTGFLLICASPAFHLLIVANQEHCFSITQEEHGASWGFTFGSVCPYHCPSCRGPEFFCSSLSRNCLHKELDIQTTKAKK